MTDKRLSLLGFASKAGKLSFGMEAVKTGIKHHKSALVVLSGEISEKSKKEILFFASAQKIPVLIWTDCDIKTVSDAVGRKCGILSINDRLFADAVKSASETGGNAND